MSIILGFGQHHVDITKDAAAAILQAAVDGGREAADDAADEAASGESACYLHTCVVDDDHAVVAGRFMHVRTDHPMSPDGWAAWTIPWCATRVVDAVSDEPVVYVAVEA